MQMGYMPGRLVTFNRTLFLTVNASDGTAGLAVPTARVLADYRVYLIIERDLTLQDTDATNAEENF